MGAVVIAAPNFVRQRQMTQVFGRDVLSGLGTALTGVLLCACVSYEDLGPSLDAAVGRNLSEVTYPQLKRLVRSTDRDGLHTHEYAYSAAGRCRWEFDVSASGQILAWRYPDQGAASSCRALAQTRP